MSTKSEVDLFKDIEIPKSFWDTILNKDTQKSSSSSSLNGKSPLKKETIPAINDEDEEIIIVKEVPAIPPDLVIQGESSEIEVHSRLYNQNPITNSVVDVDKPLHPQLHQKVLHFRKGHNLHSLFATWGRIDQLLMRKQRLMRLMAIGNVIQHCAMSKESFIKVHQESYRLNCQINALMREIQQEHRLIIEKSI
jgi:predicted RNA-binding protein